MWESLKKMLNKGKLFFKVKEKINFNGKKSDDAAVRS